MSSSLIKAGDSRITTRGVFSLDLRSISDQARLRIADAQAQASLRNAEAAAGQCDDLVVREKAVGQEVLRSVTPGQMVIKIVHDELVRTLGGGEAAGGVTGWVTVVGEVPPQTLKAFSQGLERRR